MSAPEVTEKLVAAINEDRADFYIVNFANCDMVGHTGVFDAAVKAVEAVDDAPCPRLSRRFSPRAALH